MKTITFKVDDVDYSRLMEAKDTYGFKSVYELIQAMTKNYLTLIFKQPPPDEATGSERLTEEVDTMFRELIVDDTSESPMRGYQFYKKMPKGGCSF